MKIKHLLESSSTYVTFKASSPKTNKVYYGYAPGDSDEDARRSFFLHAHSSNPDRGDTKFVTYVGNPEDIVVKALDLFDDEAEAFASRNDLRAQDANSISGPSAFPGGVYRRMLAINPNRASAWKLKRSLHDMTAREAMSEDGIKAGSTLTFAALKQLATTSAIKQQITADLDRMKYYDFMSKYFPDSTR